MKNNNKPNIVIKIADTADEFEQIHKLNYQTFVEEIDQHTEARGSDRLIDKFHHENTYIIARVDAEVIGMVAYRNKRPFSLDSKIDNLDAFFSPNDHPCEIRLLTIKNHYRHTVTFFKLMYAVTEHMFAKGHNVVVVTAFENEIKLYQHLGFEAFGHRVKSGQVYFQPMRSNWINCKVPAAAVKRKLHDNHHAKIYLTPGPIRSFTCVDVAYAAPPLPHRSNEFIEIFEQTRMRLTSLVQANYVQIALGGGTMANDMVAAQLSLRDEVGLVLSNGEFGERLIHHAKRANLRYQVLQKKWGEPFSLQEISAHLNNSPPMRWMWAVHCETSTGMLNDLAMLREVATQRHVKLILDCVSSIGTVPLDLSHVYLASGSSAKALGAKPGLAFVFHNEVIHPAADRLPTVLDLGHYFACDGVPFTISSSLIRALHAALQQFADCHYWTRNKDLSTRIRRALNDTGASVLVPENYASPAVMTVTLPKEMDAVTIGNHFSEKGIWLNYSSNYLKSRNWLQIALMGDIRFFDIIQFLDHIPEAFHF